MRPVRWLTPGTRWFITTRCLESRFFLKPTTALNQRVGFWLATALDRFPGIRLHAVYAASNHLHLIVTDLDGSLSTFGGFFLGRLAKDVNQLLDRLGPVFHRRFSAEPILDDDALVERIAYLVCNPIADRLTHTWRRWPGVLYWYEDGSAESHSFQRLDAHAYTAARSAVHSPSSVRQRDFFRTATLRLSKPTGRDGRIVAPGRVRGAVDARAAALTRQLRGQPVLGHTGVLARSPHDRPTRSERSPRPLCHASRLDVREAFRCAWRALVTAYRSAAARLRAGDTGANFPAFTFPPWRPLVSPAP